jgi:hypothetical protein
MTQSSTNFEPNAGGEISENGKISSEHSVQEDDPVNPQHYKSHPSGIECIQITEAASFLVGNAIKYIWRYQWGEGNPVDLEKAMWYLNRELDRE